MTENIESNVTSVARDVRGANEELGQASEYQRKAGRRALCLMLVLIIVVAVVLLAVRISSPILIASLPSSNFGSSK